MNIDKSDWGYVGLDPDPGFDAKHNQKVIDEVMRKNELTRKQKKREFDSKAGERISAVASYVKSVSKDKSNTTPEQYFGKRYLTELRGRQIIEKIKNAQAQEQSKAQSI